MFHMAVDAGELSITLYLEDVAIQLGFPINGEVVVHTTKYTWLKLYQELLGKTPMGENIHGQRLKNNFPLDAITEPVSNEQLHQIVQAYILRLIGVFFMPDTSENMVQMIYLSLLLDLNHAGRYSWGSAVLAFLFCEMCLATKYKQENIGRCIHLLLVWVWDKFTTLAMKRISHKSCFMDTDDEAVQYPLRPPLSARFDVNQSLTLLPGGGPLLLPLGERHMARIANTQACRELGCSARLEVNEQDKCQLATTLASLDTDGETYAYVAQSVYDQPVPVNDITRMCRHMQRLNVQLDPSDVRNHTTTGLPSFPYGPLEISGASKSRPKRMSRVHSRVPRLLE
ncbi:serine/threonine-protein phosphatase 7 long form-like protein [Senna tora]|uniref:Serine/threonine-protein phosphatase 7 long form-like protein n=1 Tax=Senna tora TaxID=362788 RepID=A0A834T3Z0_9FABA|nr:serine/threonine-protein phosphatase 7 long form-like protein [Senna tora]